MQKIGMAVIVVFTLASILMLFKSVCEFGATILASAGVVGIGAGLTGQRIIANILEGLQIALTQPIRVDDVVVVEGEWGRIKEFTLTRVVTKIWVGEEMCLRFTRFLFGT